MLISGYALGGAPGYVVGAVAALTSNFFFGQGPWTPWQMAGWGATGIAGAGLAWITAGASADYRWRSCASCSALPSPRSRISAIGSPTATTAWSSSGVFVGKGIGFDLVYAVSCFGFAMLFGPALIRTLNRFRTRIQVTWLAPAARAGLRLVLAALILSARCSKPAPRGRAAVGADRRCDISSAENRTGLGQARGQSSNSMCTAWTLLALDAAHVDPADVRNHGGVNGSRYLRDTVAQEPTRLDRADDPRGCHGGSRPGARFRVNWSARLERFIRPDGSIESLTNLTTFGVLALRARRRRAIRPG